MIFFRRVIEFKCLTVFISLFLRTAVKTSATMDRKSAQDRQVRDTCNFKQERLICKVEMRAREREREREREKE